MVAVPVNAGLVMGLCGIGFVVAFDFKSIKGPIRILIPLSGLYMLSFPGCGTKLHVATQKAKLAMMVDT